MKSRAFGSGFFRFCVPGSDLGFFGRFGRDRESFRFEARGDPGVESPGERAHIDDAVLFEQERHPGARGFVWSGAVEDDLAISRNIGLALLDLVESHAVRTRDSDGSELFHHLFAQVDDSGPGARIDEIPKRP